MNTFRLRPTFRLAALAALTLALAGCDMLGIESAGTVAARKDAEGRAIGAACRHAGRAIEDCFGLNRKADKAAVFAGWKEMNDYMRENEIAVVVPQGAGAASAPAEAATAADDGAGDETPEKGAKRKHS